MEREFEIIGEASGMILKLYPTFPIEYARRIVDLRNEVIHGHDKIDDVIIWGIVLKQFPLMLARVAKLQRD